MCPSRSNANKNLRREGYGGSLVEAFGQGEAACKLREFTCRGVLRAIQSNPIQKRLFAKVKVVRRAATGERLAILLVPLSAMACCFPFVSHFSFHFHMAIPIIFWTLADKKQAFRLPRGAAKILCAELFCESIGRLRPFPQCLAAPRRRCLSPRPPGIASARKTARSTSDSRPMSIPLSMERPPISAPRPSTGTS